MISLINFSRKVELQVKKFLVMSLLPLAQSILERCNALFAIKAQKPPPRPSQSTHRLILILIISTTLYIMIERSASGGNRTHVLRPYSRIVRIAYIWFDTPDSTLLKHHTIINYVRYNCKKIS